MSTSSGRSSGSASGPSSHRPSAALETLRIRAQILAALRRFFAERGVLEVDTPLLCAAGAVDAHVEPTAVVDPATGERRFLVTSPELCLKRLLASGSGPIYEISRAFRDGERGALHHPEFVLVEWYRPGFELDDLMDEVEALVRAAFTVTGSELGSNPWRRATYRELFVEVVGVDPIASSTAKLREVAQRGDVEPPARLDTDDRDGWLNFILAAQIEPTFGPEPLFLSEYPASQAALARLKPADSSVAERFELYAGGVELANGYRELRDPVEQRERFERANRERVKLGKSALPIDERLLAALGDGFPEASGVALGFDRLVMLAVGGECLDDVVAFPRELA